jgi:hypothetical protein
MDEARVAGATPILVTSITHRNLTPEWKVTMDSLVPYVEEVRELAAAKHILFIDMFALTIAHCEQEGAAGCDAPGAPIGDGIAQPKIDIVR